MSASPPFDLVMVFKTVYEELTKQEYDIEPRDFMQAKNLLKLNPDWNFEKMEIKMRSHLPQYLKSDFWKSQNFPAYGLFTSFNSFKPQPTKVASKPVRSLVIECSTCHKNHGIDEKCVVEYLQK